MEIQLYSILENIISENFKIVQVISEPTKKWSGHSRTEDMEFLFSKEREILVMKSTDSPSSIIKPDHQLSLARWLRNEVPRGNMWSPDEQTLYHATIAVGKTRMEVVVILSRNIEIALEKAA